MARLPPEALTLPSSYSSLPYTQIRTSHVPESSPSPTPIILLTLYRPQNNNAFTETMASELEHAFTLFDLDDRVRCIVVTGHGKMFCPGADLSSAFRGGEMKPQEHRDSGGRVAIAIHNCRKPTIAAINGSAVGVGITMTLPMSIRITTSKAKIGFVFARRGIIMEACSSYFLPRLVGYSRAVHLCTTGATYPADNRLLQDLFSEIIDKPEDVLPRAMEIARDVADNTSTVSTYLMRQMMWRGPGSAEAAHLLGSRVIYELFGTTDNKEGVNAFLEKRPVQFSGTMETDGPAVYPWWEPVDIHSRVKANAMETKSKL